MGVLAPCHSVIPRDNGGTGGIVRREHIPQSQLVLNKGEILKAFGIYVE